jgi:hypothetical protein
VASILAQHPRLEALNLSGNRAWRAGAQAALLRVRACVSTAA